MPAYNTEQEQDSPFLFVVFGFPLPLHLCLLFLSQALPDGVCFHFLMQICNISYSLLCRWFQAAVLPLDAALYAEIIKDRDEVKRCCECGATFQPKSNRAKYCAACAKRMRRRKEAERQRKRYWQHEA